MCDLMLCCTFWPEHALHARFLLAFTASCRMPCWCFKVCMCFLLLSLFVWPEKVLLTQAGTGLLSGRPVDHLKIRIMLNMCTLWARSPAVRADSTHRDVQGEGVHPRVSGELRVLLVHPRVSGGISGGISQNIRWYWDIPRVSGELRNEFIVVRVRIQCQY